MNNYNNLGLTHEMPQAADVKREHRISREEIDALESNSFTCCLDFKPLLSISQMTR